MPLVEILAPIVDGFFAKMEYERILEPYEPGSISNTFSGLLVHEDAAIGNVDQIEEGMNKKKLEKTCSTLRHY